MNISWKDFSEAYSIICQACIMRDKDNKTCFECPVHRTAGMYYKEVDANMLYQGIEQSILNYRIQEDVVLLLFDSETISVPKAQTQTPLLTEQDKVGFVICSLMPVIREMYRKSDHNDDPVYMALLRYLMTNLK